MAIVSAQQILTRCEILAGFSEEPQRLTRTFLSAPMHDVHRCLGEWMQGAGMSVRVDPIGNLIGRYGSNREDTPRLLIGSHVDTVPDAGKYDGILGVLLGIEVVRSLHHRPLPFAVEVIAFSEEEGVRYRIPFLGSSALSGCFNDCWLQRVDASGIVMAEAIRQFGLDPTRIPEAAYSPKSLLGYLEVHIEQGPVLESQGVPLGIVEAIVGQHRFSLCFQGKAGHAGTLPMEYRRDALTAAAEFVGAVEQCARDTPGLRATVGSLAVSPGAINVVPGEVRCSLDLRHADDAQRRTAAAHLLDLARSIAARRSIELSIEPMMDQNAVPTDSHWSKLLEESARGCGVCPVRMTSGAGHDAGILARRTPVAMLFVRSPGGISHHPDEAVFEADVALALEVVIVFLDRLAGAIP